MPGNNTPINNGGADPFDQLDLSSIDHLPVANPFGPAYEGEFFDDAVNSRQKEYQREYDQFLKNEEDEKQKAQENLAKQAKNNISNNYLKMGVLSPKVGEVRLIKNHKRVFHEGEFEAGIRCVVYIKPDKPNKIYYDKFFRDEDGNRHGLTDFIKEHDDPVNYQYFLKLIKFRRCESDLDPDADPNTEAKEV